MIFPTVRVLKESIRILSVKNISGSKIKNIFKKEDDTLKRVCIVSFICDERFYTSPITLSESEIEKLKKLETSKTNNTIDAEIYSIIDYKDGKIGETGALLKSLKWKD